MTTYPINVFLSFLPYLIIGAFLFLFGVLLEPLARRGLTVERPDKHTHKRVRLFLCSTALAIWLFGLFLALVSPSNIPKRETFDRAASHRAISERAAASLDRPKPEVKDETLKPQSRQDREEKFKTLTDYKARREKQ